MTVQRAAMAGAVLWLALLWGGLAGCASAKPALVVSGTTLHVAADTFVETAALMDKALDTGAVTPAQYAAWSTFGRRYQVAYPLAVKAWEIAVQTDGSASTQTAAETISALVSELAAFYVQASLAITRPPGGTP